MTFCYWLCHTLAKAAAKLLYGFEVIHPERRIEEGPALIACNHQSFFDPPCVSAVFHNPIYFLARKSLFDHRLLAALITRLNTLPVDQSRPDFTGLKRIISLLRRGERVLIFPEGERTFDGELGRAKPGVGLVIAKSRAPVLPVRIFGAYEIFPRHAKRPRLRGKITVVVGKPIDFSEDIAAGGGKDLYRRLGERTLAAIAELELPGEPAEDEIRP